MPPRLHSFRLPTLRLSATAAAAALLAATVLTAAPATAVTTAAATDYCGGQCSDILPPGENGNATLADILANKIFGTRPAHTADQLGPYANLASAYPNLTNAQLNNFFNDASFGVPSSQVASSEQPRSDVTIVRDKATGVPHITGTTRYGTEYGAGYAAAEDRLWVMDLFRHVGRGELSSFAGGAAANRQLEQSFFQAAPYTEDELQAQIDHLAATGGPRAQQALADANAYVDGINAYITKAYNARNFPGEYVLTGHVDSITNAGSIEPFKLTDLVALASVVGALFGTGGGGELQSAQVKLAAEAKYGKTEGDKVWTSFREANDPEAVQTLHNGQSFPYADPPDNPSGVAMPDAGSVVPEQLIYDATGSANTATTAAKGVLPGNLLTAKHGMSNALLVSGKYTDDGHPIAVFGPQTGYFAPQLLMLEELQGPGLSARGAAFAGLSFYVELGRGQDYSWSATTAAQDITDTYAVPLCTTDGSAVTLKADHYLWHGTCTAMDRLERQDSWKPTTADSTPAGSYTLVMNRTNYGLVIARGTVGGKPVAFTSLRSTYRHEADSILGFQMLNDPAAVNSPATFQQAAQNINYTFNWFYADSSHIAYYNSGANPVRAPGVDPGLPILGQQSYEWSGFDPGTNTADYTPAAQHPQSIDQDYYISWNNKQANDFSAAGFGNGSVHRANLLDDRVKALVNGSTKITRARLVQAMESAAVTDLRGEDVLPKLLRVIRSAAITDSSLEAVVKKLETWVADGAQRKETSAGSHTYADADAIRIMDAWWPLLAVGEFKPGLGDDLFTALTGAVQINESPSGGQTGPTSGTASANESIPHKGSSFQYGWWSYVDKDLRAVLGDTVNGGLAEPYCGGGVLSACRQVLLDTLKQAAAQTAAQVYPGDDSCSAGDQWCADSIIQRPLGGITDDKISWQNRPTYQQVVQYTGHR